MTLATTPAVELDTPELSDTPEGVGVDGTLPLTLPAGMPSGSGATGEGAVKRGRISMHWSL
jgi:hypothetical protein